MAGRGACEAALCARTTASCVEAKPRPCSTTGAQYAAPWARTSLPPERSESRRVVSPSREKEEERRRRSTLPDRLARTRAALGSLLSNSRLTCKGGAAGGRLCACMPGSTAALLAEEQPLAHQDVAAGIHGGHTCPSGSPVPVLCGAGLREPSPLAPLAQRSPSRSAAGSACGFGGSCGRPVPAAPEGRERGRQVSKMWRTHTHGNSHWRTAGVQSRVRTDCEHAVPAVPAAPWVHLHVLAAQRQRLVVPLRVVVELQELDEVELNEPVCKGRSRGADRREAVCSLKAVRILSGTQLAATC